MKVLVVLASWLLLSLMISGRTLAQADDFDLSLQPATVEIAVQPDKLVTQAFELQNSGTRDLEVTLTLQDFTSDNVTGNPVLLPTNTFPYALLQNSEISLDTPFVLPAGKSQQIVFGIKPPLDAPEEDWYFVLLAKTKPTEGTLGTETGAQTTGSIATPLLVRISSTNQFPLNWSMRLKNIPRVIDSLQSVQPELWVENQSRTYAQPDATLLILDWRQQIVGEYTALPDRILAGATRQIFAQQTTKDDPRSLEATPFHFDPLFAVGPYTVRATIRNATGGPVVVEERLWALPLSPLLAILAFFLLTRLAAWLKRRSSVT